MIKLGKIIDISHHQPSAQIDWAKAAKEVDLVIIRVQYGSALIDREYKNHVANAKKYGIPFGHYAYGRFVSVEDAKVEARDFLNRIDKSAKFLVLDTEDDTVISCGTEKLAEASQAFIDVCKASGYKTGFYVSHHLYKQYGLDKVKADFLWIPRYGGNDGTPNKKPDYNCDIWQYTDNGKAGWYGGRLDFNQLLGDKKLEWYISQEKTIKPREEKVSAEIVTKPNKPTSKRKKNSDGTYTVVSGDTLSEIAADFNVTTNDLASWNNIANKNEIKVGQKLKFSAPKKATKPKPAASGTKKITIKKGDTLSELAVKYKTTVSNLKALNGYKSDTIYAGKTMKVPSNASSNTSTKKNYTVKSGDNATKIAKNNGITLAKLKELNPSKKNWDLVYPGDKLRIK
ncbi:LysM peptidoglycan-binding domain-containing protein [Niallia circulans]|uniref:LysM peptidoglycan-binding domain-containing protein n=1 Tax=Niallia circulans TaxID=1397 RepID=UPI0035260B04